MNECKPLPSCRCRGRGRGGCGPGPGARSAQGEGVVVVIIGAGARAGGAEVVAGAVLQRRKLNLKAIFDSSLSHFSFRHLAPIPFIVGLKGST